MSKKILVAAVLALGMFSGSAGAEQAAADTYRQIFQSEEFYVEYEDNYAVRIVAQKAGKRLTRMNYGNWGIFGGGSKYPEVMYKDGKYYQFLSAGKAIVCEQSRLADENLDPRQGWNGIGQKLALPLELAVFYWNDPYREKKLDFEAPKETWSGKKTLGKIEYDCDRYASRVYSASSGESWYIYEMLYDKGALKKIYSYVKKGEEEYPVNKLDIKKIGSKWPDNLFKIDAKTKVCAAGTGDMNDLLEQPVVVGVMEGI